jgi:hypothetical protein
MRVRADRRDNLHPIVANFRARYPRAYGLIALAVAVLLGETARHATAGRLIFLLLLLSVASGVTGVLYTVWGAKCNEWDARFLASFNPDGLTWQQACGLTGFGMILLALTLALYRVMGFG